MGPRKVFAALAALSLMFTSCSGNEDSTSRAAGTVGRTAGTTGGGAEQPVEGGILRVADARPIQSLDPLDVPSYVPFVAKFFAVYDGLVLDGPAGDIEPRLAETLETEDGVTWTLTLRPGLVFSDGTPLDAEAVAYNWERFRGSNSAYAYVAQSIASTETVNTRTLRFELESPDFAFDDLVSQTPLNLIGSPSAIEELGPDFGKSPVGAGAFVLKSFDPDTAVVFERNQLFHGHVYLDGVEFQIIPDARAAFNTIVAGGADAMLLQDVPLTADARQTPDLEVAENVYDGGASIVFSMSKPPFDDIRARRAIALMVDSEALNDAVFGGDAEVPRSLFLEDSDFFADDLLLPSPDREAAQELLDELAADGETLEIHLLTIDTQSEVAEWLAAELQSYDNVTIEIDGPYPSADYATRIYGGDFEIATAANFWANVDVQMADVFVTGRPLNFSNYSSEAVDEIFAEIRLTADEDERRQLIRDAQQRILEDLPTVFTYRQTMALIAGRRVHGERLTPQRVIVLDEIWLDE